MQYVIKVLVVFILIFLIIWVKSHFIEKIGEPKKARIINTVITGVLVIGLTGVSITKFQKTNYNDQRSAIDRVKDIVGVSNDKRSKVDLKEVVSSFNNTNNTAQTAATEYTPDDQLRISLIYSENPGGSRNVNTAIAAVINNRLNSQNYPNNVSEVIYQQNEFPSVYTGNLISFGNIPEENRAQIFEDMSKADPTGGALYFYNKALKSDEENNWIISGPYGATEIDGYVFLTVFPYA